MTNADKIRQMSDEELDNLLYNVCFSAIWKYRKDDEPTNWLEWLKQEVTDNA